VPLSDSSFPVFSLSASFLSAPFLFQASFFAAAPFPSAPFDLHPDFMRFIFRDFKSPDNQNSEY
jgi:hypothetical protein